MKRKFFFLIIILSIVSSSSFFSYQIAYGDVAHFVTHDRQGTHANGWTGSVFTEKFTGLGGAKITNFQMKFFASGGGNVRIKAYADNGTGFPGALINETGSLAIGGTNFRNFPIIAKVPSDGTVWLGFEADTAGTDIYYTNQVPDAFAPTYKIHVYGSGPNPFGTPTATNYGNEFYMAANYTIPESNFTNYNVGTTQAFSLNNLWAEKFTGLPVGGKIRQLWLNTTAYGGVPDLVRVKVYDDTALHGFPNLLLDQDGGGGLAQTDGAKTAGVIFGLNTTIPNDGTVWMAFENNDVGNPVSFYGKVLPLGTSVVINHAFGAGPTPFGAYSNQTFNPWARITVQFLKTTLTVSPSSGATGQNVNVTGVLFGAATNTDIYFNGVKQKQVPHSGTSFSTLVRVPFGATLGANTFNGTDQSGSPKLSAIATYTVTSPSLILNSTNGNVAKTISAKGTGYINNTSTVWKYDSNALTTNPAIPNTNSTGGLTNVIFTIPKSVAGLHTIKVLDGYGNNGTATYNVTSSISISPVSGIVGSTTTLNGDGFKGNQALTFKFDGVQIATGVTNVLGSFTSKVLTIPNAIQGGHTIVTSDGSHSVSSSFNVTGGLPSPVSDLHAITINPTNVTLGWTQPNLNGLTLKGYQINYTTPHSTPLTIIVNNTNSSTTSYTISGLTTSTDYSFRVGIWAGNVKNMQGNILDITTTSTFIQGNFTVGSLQFNSTNPLTIPIKFVRTDNGNNTNLQVIYSSSFNLQCDLSYKFAQTNRTYSNLPNSPYSTGTVSTTFQFKNSTSEVIYVSCTDKITGANGKYIITQSNFPFIQQLKQMKSGSLGTTSQFGAIDLITLAVVIVSMIGFNRLNEAVGVIFNIIVLGVLAFYGVIQWPTIVAGVIALILLLALAGHRKIPGT